MKIKHTQGKWITDGDKIKSGNKIICENILTPNDAKLIENAPKLMLECIRLLNSGILTCRQKENIVSLINKINK